MCVQCQNVSLMVELSFMLLSSADSPGTKYIFLMGWKKVQGTHDIRLFREIISSLSLWSRKNLL